MLTPTNVFGFGMPNVNPEIVGAEEGFLIGIDGDAVDVVGVGIGVNSPGRGFDHSIDALQRRNAKTLQPLVLYFPTVFFAQVEAFRPLCPLRYFP